MGNFFCSGGFVAAEILSVYIGPLSRLKLRLYQPQCGATNPLPVDERPKGISGRRAGYITSPLLGRLIPESNPLPGEGCDTYLTYLPCL